MLYEKSPSEQYNDTNNYQTFRLWNFSRLEWLNWFYPIISKLTRFHQLFIQTMRKKSRLIKVPSGTKLNAANDSLLEFPNGTIIAKTFYYFNDKRNASLGKKIIETRILELKSGNWVAGTYIWNDSQSDAILSTTGGSSPVNWTNENRTLSTNYHIPSLTECQTCHNASNKVTPIWSESTQSNNHHQWGFH
ncbi:MAG: hypothetical protein QM734_13550 [Cyclobacteriaceae bacterium]